MQGRVGEGVKCRVDVAGLFFNLHFTNNKGVKCMVKLRGEVLLN